MVPKPHFLLFCDGQSPRVPVATNAVGTASISIRGRWRFILEDLDAGTRLEAGDAELVQAPERAALMAVVRGLEALEQPSRVTLVTTSRYVSRGLQFGLTEWRESNYCWEHFGSVQPIRNADLWRRIDHAMQFHQIHCQWIAGQESVDGESMTKLQAEPIAQDTDSPVAVCEPMAAATGSSELKLMQPQHGFERDAIAANSTVSTAEIAPSTYGWLHFSGIQMVRARIRELRLPNLSKIQIRPDHWLAKFFGNGLLNAR